MLLSPILFKKKRYPNYVGAGSAANHAAAGLIIDLHAAMATGMGPNSNTGASKGICTDLSGNGLNGTLTGFDYISGSGWNGNLLELDGVNDYVALPTGLQIPHNCTFEFWSKANNKDNHANQLLFFRNGDNINNCFIHINQSWGGYSVAVGEDVETGVIGLDGNPIADVVNQCLVWLDATKIYLSVNNSTPVTVTDTTTKRPFSFGIPRIGGNQWAGSYFPGNFAIGRIYNRILTASERTQNYNAGVTWPGNFNVATNYMDNNIYMDSGIYMDGD